MASIKQILNHAEQSCSANGTRMTDKRKQVLTGLLKTQKALSAYELANFCKEEFDDSIPAMSVYRILEFLESENFVHKLHIANKYVACSHISCAHAHEQPQFLICDKCEDITEIAIRKNIIKTLKAQVHEADYVMKSTQLELHCLCKKCA